MLLYAYVHVSLNCIMANLLMLESANCFSHKNLDRFLRNINKSPSWYQACEKTDCIPELAYKPLFVSYYTSRVLCNALNKNIF